MKLVIHPAIDESRLEKVRHAAGEMAVVNCATRQQAIAEIRDADGFFGKMTPDLLQAAQKLKWVQTPTASLEHYLFPELVAHPCLLSNMRGLYSDVIADHVMAMVLCFARNFHVYLRQQTWAPVGKMAGDFVTGPAVVSEADKTHRHLSDQTLGVVGCGAIGKEILRRAAAFGMSLQGVDPVVRDVPELDLLIRPLSELPELLQSCDFVVIAAPHTPETEKLFNRAMMRNLRPSAYLINIGRGAIVDLNDLTAALEAKELAGAGLDVFEIEPLPDSHPLWKMPNVILTPHVAACSTHIAERHLATLCENVRRFAHGEPLLNLADKTKWY
jgi:phosphoglycerate dehydrogenase-like enzyme